MRHLSEDQRLLVLMIVKACSSGRVVVVVATVQGYGYSRKACYREWVTTVRATTSVTLKRTSFFRSSTAQHPHPSWKS